MNNDNIPLPDKTTMKTSNVDERQAIKKRLDLYKAGVASEAPSPEELEFYFKTQIGSASIRDIPFELQTNTLVRRCLLRTALYVDDCNLDTLNEEDVEYILARNPNLAVYLPSRLINHASLMYVLLHDRKLFLKLPDCLITEEFFIDAIANYNLSIKYIDLKYQSVLIMQEWVKAGGDIKSTVSYADPRLLCDDLLAIALQNSIRYNKSLDAPAKYIVRAHKKSLELGFTDNMFPTDCKPPALFAYTTMKSLAKRPDALLKLFEMGPTAVAPWVDCDWKAEVYKDLFGVEAAIKNLKRPKIAREWLAQDIGL